MGQVNIAVTLDSDALVASVQNGALGTGSLDSPQSIGANATSDAYIYMIAQNSVVVNNQAGSELTVQVSSGDQIRWNMTTFDNNSKYTAFIYKSQFNLTSGTPPIGLSDVQYANQQIGVRLPEGSDPTGPLGQYVNHIYPASTSVNAIDQTIQYTLSFQLVDNETGVVFGYFVWDPFINIPF